MAAGDMPDRGSGGAIGRALVTRLGEQIATGVLPPGSRLMSIRKAAAHFGVSKNTMVEVYDRLVAAGQVVARPGSGFVVCEPPESEAVPRPRHVAEAVDIASLLGAQLEQVFDVRVGDGRPPPSWTEQSEVRRHLSANGRVLPEESEAYGSALGYLPMRQQIARRLAARSIAAREDNILLTFGANHALDLIVRATVAAGDTVLVDEPGYYPLFAKLKLAQVRMVGVRRNPDGPDVADFVAKLASDRPRVFFTQSLAHNPTGGSISLPVAHAVLTAAARHNVLIVEDDPFADLPTTVDNRLVRLDQLNDVLSVGTFSKTLSASLRSGFIAGRADRIAALAELKMLTTVNSSGHVERLLHRLLAEGHYDRHLKRLARRVAAASERVLGRLEQARCRTFSADTGGGYYLYLMLPEGIDDIEIARLGAKEGIFIAPGSVFCLDKRNPVARGLRINVARADDPRFYDFLLRRLT